MQAVVVAERLRRQTRNLLGSPRAGSNPADYDNTFGFVLFMLYYVMNIMLKMVDKILK